MPVAWTECQWCRSKRRSYFYEEDLARLKRGEPLYHVCQFCLVPTAWALVEPRKPGEVPPDDVTLRGVSVLLIDDDHAILKVLTQALAHKNFYVDTAESAREALQKMTSEYFDLVLSDIRMPGFDGKKLYSFIEEFMPEYKQRVVFLTGDTESPETQDFLARTGCPCVFKPVDFPQLFRTLGERLDARRAGEPGGQTSEKE